MQLSRDDRAALVRRVEQRLGARISRASIEAIVDQVTAHLPVPDESPSAEVVLAFTAESMPDLASRLRRRITDAGIAIRESGAATVGRHTVFTLRVVATARESLSAIARDIGARMVDADAATAGAGA